MVWWQAPVIPATWEAAAEELLEPGRRRWQQAEIAPLYSSLGDKSKTLCLKKKERKLTFFKRDQNASHVHLQEFKLSAMNIKVIRKALPDSLYIFSFSSFCFFFVFFSVYIYSHRWWFIAFYVIFFFKVYIRFQLYNRI